MKNLLIFQHFYVWFLENNFIKLQKGQQTEYMFTKMGIIKNISKQALFNELAAIEHQGKTIQDFSENNHVKSPSATFYVLLLRNWLKTGQAVCLRTYWVYFGFFVLKMPIAYQAICVLM